MATTAGPLVDTVLRRVRDPQGSAHSRSLVRWLLSLAQQIANGGLRSVLSTVSFTTAPLQQIYSMTALVPSAIRIVAVREGDRNLAPVAWGELSQVDRHWSRRVGDRYEVWAPIGRDLFVLHPAQPSSATVVLVVAKLTNSLTVDTSVVELPDDAQPVMLDLTEALLNLKNRSQEPGAAALERLAGAWVAAKTR